MLVEVDGEGTTMVLKLYDRRCCPKLRDKVPYDWNEVAENEYKSFVELEKLINSDRRCTLHVQAILDGL